MDKTMKKLFWLVFLLNFGVANALYHQQGKIFVYTENLDIRNTVKVILEKFNLSYEIVTQLNKNEESLYIINGNLNNFKKYQLPKHYILYQSEVINHGISNENLNLLNNAIAVWDNSWNNINKYKSSIKNFYYVPNENYVFLDPIILPCFLPIKALSTYKKMLEYSNTMLTDISDHIPTLFCHCFLHNPSIIIESGVGSGLGSTVPIHAVATLLNAHMVGIDISDCSNVYSKFNNAYFLKINDLEFPDYFKKMNLKKETIDFIFIDTSHQYIHTLREIEVFVSMLSENGILAFHDSNVTPLDNNSAYERINNTSSYVGMGNPRGVTQAIKEYFNLSFDEFSYFNDFVKKDNYRWEIIHYPYCNGLTLLKRLDRI